MTLGSMDYAEPPGKRGGASGSATVVTVNFRQDTLFAIDRSDGVFVAITPICNALGLDAKRQRDRIQRDPILREGGAMVALPSAGGVQDTFCLRLDLINGWLFTIEESRVRGEETRRRVLDYKRECYSALFRHFYGRRNEPGDETHEGNAPKVKMVTEVRHTFGIPAAKQLWLRLQLPVVPAMVEAAGQGDLFLGSDEKAA